MLKEHPPGIGIDYHGFSACQGFLLIQRTLDSSRKCFRDLFAPAYASLLSRISCYLTGSHPEPSSSETASQTHRHF
jgi:hypothetical protein